MLQLHPDWVCLGADIKNCYNEQNKGAVLDVLDTAEGLRHLSTFSGAILAPSPDLEERGRVWGKSTTGQIQGDPASGPLEAVAIQPSLVKLDRACAEDGGIARAGADDVYCVGPQETVLAALQQFATDIKQRCDLEIQWSKTVLQELLRASNWRGRDWQTPFTVD